MIKHTIVDLLQFLKRPIDERDERQGMAHRTQTFLILFAFEILLMGVIMAGISLLIQSGLIDASQHELGDLLSRFPTWALFLLGVIFVPILEELIFRFSLQYDRNIPMLIIGGLFNEDKVKNYWDRFYRSIFYTSSILFAYAHIFNYGKLSITILAFSPLLVLPQFVMGNVAGYLRVRFGFLWACALHMLHNFLFIGMVIASMNVALPKADIQNEDYSFSLEEIPLSNINTSSKMKVGDDSLVYLTMPTDALISDLKDIPRESLKIRAKGIKNYRYNIFFRSHFEGQNGRDTIFKELQKIYDVELVKGISEHIVYELIVSDSNLLSQHEVQDSLLQRMNCKSNFKRTEMTSYKVKHLKIWLDNFMREDITTDIDDTRLFDFSLPSTKKFADMRDTLSLKYGLGFKLHRDSSDIWILKDKVADEY